MLKDPCWKSISFSCSSPKIHSQNHKIKENPEISNTQKPKNSNKTQFISNNQQQNQTTRPTWLIESNKHTNLEKPNQTQLIESNSAHWIFFFFLVSFFGFGYLIFGFDFLGLGIRFGFLILGFGSSQRFQRFFRSCLKIAGVGFFFVLVGSEHGL